MTAFIVFGTVGIGLLHAIVATWAFVVFPPRRRRNRTLAGAAGIVILLALLPPVARWGCNHLVVTFVYHAAMVEVTFVALSAIPLLAFLVASLFWRRARPPEVGETQEQPAPPTIGRREAAGRAVGLAAFGTSALAVGWGMVRSRHDFTVEEVVVRIAGLPRVLDGYTIAQISDIHAGLFVGDRELAEGLSRVREVRADLLVVTGDMVDMDAHFAPQVGRALADVGAYAPDGIVAILGNHDYYAWAPHVAAALRAAGVEVLVNEGKMMRRGDGGGFALLGVDDTSAPRFGGAGPNLDIALAMVDPAAPRILLAHNPLCMDVAAGHVALQLSGHTHGGQINPAGVRVAALLTRYVAGRYERAGTTLWVNRGFGVTGPPLRLDAAPEVTKLVLISG